MRSRVPLLILIALTAVGAGAFFTGITWGLPSRGIDAFLFGPRDPWPGEVVQALAGERDTDPSRGADVPATARIPRDRPTVLNSTDEDRARIIRRYRLYTYQPDEMVTLMALAGMSPGAGDLDPKLYQYGGLWIYPVGAAIRAAAVFGWVQLEPDVAHYLDRPEAFGGLYVVMRAFTAVWALAGIVAVFLLVRRMTGGCTASAATAGLCYIFMPVVMNMAHEAKPHLPGTVLMLLAVVAADRYLRSGSRRAAMMLAILCGAAAGMVLSAAVILVLVPVAMWLAHGTRRERLRRTAAGLAVSLAVYAVTNPYVVINLFVNRDVLRSNLGNTMAMFERTGLLAGLPEAVLLIVACLSPVLAVAGVAGVFALLIAAILSAGSARVVAPAPHGCEDVTVMRTGWLLAVPAILIAIHFTLHVKGQPGEYGRFALFPAIALMIAAVVAVHRILRPVGLQRAVQGLLILATLPWGLAYLGGFVRDTTDDTSRHHAARQLADLHRQGFRTVGVVAEPAPYVMPPVDLFAWEITMLPDDPADWPEEAMLDILLYTDVLRGRLGGWERLYGPWEAFAGGAGRPRPPGPGALSVWLAGRFERPVSWADRRFEIFVRRADPEPDPAHPSEIPR